MRVGPAKIGSSVEGASTVAGSGKILKFSLSKIHHLAYSQRELMRKLTENYAENCMCLAANRYLFQYSNEYIQIIGFQT